jgi:hypothetical protein
LLHAQIHHLGQYYLGVLQLRQLQDLVLMAERAGGSLDWRAVDGRLARFRLRPVLDSYLLAAERMFGMRWPLDRPASLGGRLHHWRCLVQLRRPELNRAAVPWSNLRGAFAWHRMEALYGRQRGGYMRWQTEHAWRFIRRRNIEGVMTRLFRAE